MYPSSHPRAAPGSCPLVCRRLCSCADCGGLRAGLSLLRQGYPDPLPGHLPVSRKLRIPVLGWDRCRAPSPTGWRESFLLTQLLGVLGTRVFLPAQSLLGGYPWAPRPLCGSHSQLLPRSLLRGGLPITLNLGILPGPPTTHAPRAPSPDLSPTYTDYCWRDTCNAHLGSLLVSCLASPLECELRKGSLTVLCPCHFSPARTRSSIHLSVRQTDFWSLWPAHLCWPSSFLPSSAPRPRTLCSQVEGVASLDPAHPVSTGACWFLCPELMGEPSQGLCRASPFLRSSVIWKNRLVTQTQCPTGRPGQDRQNPSHCPAGRLHSVAGAAVSF